MSFFQTIYSLKLNYENEIALLNLCCIGYAVIADEIDTKKDPNCV